VFTILGRITGTKIIIDFHNYGYTILNLNVKNRLVIWLATKYERIFGRLAHYYLCVCNSMKEDLKDNWGIEYHFLFIFNFIRATTVYDKANKNSFKPFNENEKKKFYQKMEKVIFKEKFEAKFP